MMKHGKGFTLVEMMVVLAIIAIISSIAYPSYTAYVQRGHRADAMRELEGLAAAMQQVYLRDQTYNTANGGDEDFTSEAPSVNLYTRDTNPNYELVLVDVKQESFTIRAVPIDDSIMDGDGFLELRSNGQKGWDRNDLGGLGSDEMCWRKDC